MTLSPGSGSPNQPLRFVGGVVVDPGTYSLRLAVVDQEGRRGSVVRDISAWKMAGEPFALGDLVVGPVPPQGKGVAIQVEPYVRTDGVAAYLELYSTDEATWQGTTPQLPRRSPTVRMRPRWQRSARPSNPAASRRGVWLPAWCPQRRSHRDAT